MKKHPAADAVMNILAATILIMIACAAAIFLVEAAVALIHLVTGWLG